MEFEFGFVDKVKVENNDNPLRSQLMDKFKQGMSKRYESSLQKVKSLIRMQGYDPSKHIRFLKISIWHFDAIKARYFIAVNPIFVTIAAFNKDLVSLLILDAVVIVIMCILLGLSTHDDCITEGEGFI